MSKNTKIIIGVLVIVVIIAIISTVRSNSKLAELKKAAPSQEATPTAEVEKMLAQVGQHIVLPTDETPTAAVVSDLSKLKGQPFFDRAQLGDVVLVYANARRVILWRPSVQKIVEVSAINFPEAGQAPVTQATDTKKTR